MSLKRSRRVTPAILGSVMSLMSVSLMTGCGEEEVDVTNRERQVMEFISRGYTNHRIADELFISPHTVRKHMTNIYEKLHVNSKVEAVRLAMQKKWV